MPRYVPPSIEEIGLQSYLNNNATSHNGYGFDDFVKLFSTGVNKVNLAKAFGVDRKTIDRWLEIYEGSGVKK